MHALLSPGTDSRRTLLNLSRLGFDMPLIAAALGITKQAISFHMEQEDRNETISFDEKLRTQVAKARIAPVQLAAAQLTKQIAGGNFRAIKFFLERRTEEFKPPERAITLKMPEEKAREGRDALVALVASMEGKFGDDGASKRVASTDEGDDDFG